MGVILRALRRLAFAVLMSAALTTAAGAAMYVTTAPKFVSLLVEPLSLLLMPGLLVALVQSGPHDFSPTMVALIAFGFYAVFFYLALWYWARIKSYRRRGSR